MAEPRTILRSAAPMMRRVLVDHARARGAAKRGREATCIALSDAALAIRASTTSDPLNVDVLALEAALARLKELGPRHSELIELRSLGGLSIAEAAEVLKVSPATAKRDWTLAQAWLYRELRGERRA